VRQRGDMPVRGASGVAAHEVVRRAARQHDRPPEASTAALDEVKTATRQKEKEANTGADRLQRVGHSRPSVRQHRSIAAQDPHGERRRRGAGGEKGHAKSGEDANCLTRSAIFPRLRGPGARSARPKQ